MEMTGPRTVPMTGPRTVPMNGAGAGLRIPGRGTGIDY